MAPVSIQAPPKELQGREITDVDFSGQNLRNAKMQRSTFTRCNFDKANLSNADCEGSRFPGSTMRGTICYRTNFRNAQLPTVFDPEDAYGMTVTLACQTFKGVKIGKLWWFCWLIFATQMTPANDTENLKDLLIALIGAERYVKLTQLFARREI